MRTKILAALAATTLAVIVAACGGGGGAAPAPTTTISGSAVKGPVSGATVTVRSAATNAVLATTSTGAAGSYSVSVQFAGDVVVEVSGGTYIDEATNLSTPLATPLKVVLNASGGNVTGVVTPLTTMAYTYAFGSTGVPNSTAFNTMATNLATQFQLAGVSLVTTLPTVSGTSNAYGKVLAALSKYMQLNNVTLPAIVNSSFTTGQWTAFSGAFTTAYNAANPGSNVTYNFNGNLLTIAGTGAGGGTGSCGVNVLGNITANNFTVPVNLDYCITGIRAGSCTSGNASLSQALSGQKGLAGAANLTYTYSAVCVANPAVTIALP